MRPNRTLLVDSGFWFGILDESDEHREVAELMLDEVLKSSYIVPWPILYETLRTRLVRRPKAILQFETFLKRPNAVVLDDLPYRDSALELVLLEARRGTRAISLADSVIRLILDDVNVVKHGLVTTNPRDFEDICRPRGIEIV